MVSLTRTVAAYQTGSDGNATVYYELVRAELRDNEVVVLTASDPSEFRNWTKQGILVKGTWVPVAAGAAFLDALRDDFNHGGRTFALDSARGEHVPVSLFEMMPKAKFSRATVSVK